jgi:TRAP-type C4-dicarboxylate transport system substrate-binding protein
MKKLFVLSIVLVISLSMVLAGCQGETTTVTTTTTQTVTSGTSTTTSEPTTEPTSEPPKETVKLTFSYHAPQQASLAEAIFEPWAADIEAASNGRIEIETFPGGSLASAAEAYDAVSTGLVDIAQVDTEETPGRFPVSGFSALQFLLPNTSIAGPVSHDIFTTYASNELSGVQLMVTAPMFPSQLLSTSPIHTLEDFSGKTVRASGSIETLTVESLGGIPRDVSTGDLFSSFDRGALDAGFLTYSAVLAFGLIDAIDYITETNAQIRTHIVVMNKSKYESLPDDVKDILADFMGPEASYKYAKEHDAISGGPKGAISGIFSKSGKDPIYVLPDDERARWKEAIQPTWEEYASSVPEGQDVLDAIPELVEKYQD